MKKILAIILILVSTATLAQTTCTTTYSTRDGKVVACLKCCTASGCIENCN